MGTLASFRDSLEFAPEDIGYVNKQIFIGVSWWACDPDPEPVEAQDFDYVICDSTNMGEVIAWNAEDVNEMIRAGVEKATNGSAILTYLSQAIDSGQYLDVAFFTSDVANMMLQIWHYGRVTH